MISKPRTVDIIRVYVNFVVYDHCKSGTPGKSKCKPGVSTNKVRLNCFCKLESLAKIIIHVYKHEAAGNIKPFAEGNSIILVVNLDQ